MKIDELVQAYIKTRDKKARLKAEYDAACKPTDAVQDKIEAALLVKFGELGVDSAKTPEGTAYLSARTTASIADWDSFRAFCLAQPDPFEFIDRRAAKAAVENFKSQNAELPPGINWSETRTVNFRRA